MINNSQINIKSSTLSFLHGYWWIALF